MEISEIIRYIREKDNVTTHKHLSLFIKDRKKCTMHTSYNLIKSLIKARILKKEKYFIQLEQK